MASVQLDMQFHIVGKTVDDKQNFKTIAQMKAYPELQLSKTAMATNDEDGKLYVYNVNNEVNENTGKWRAIDGIEPVPVYEDNTAYFFISSDCTDTELSLKIDSTVTAVPIENRIAKLSLTGIYNIETTATTADSLLPVIGCVINNNSTLNKLNLNYSMLETLTINNCTELRYLYLFETPISQNKEELGKIGDMVCDRNGSNFGSIIVGSTDNDVNENIKILTKKVEKIYIDKDWYFGSSLMFTDYNRIPKQIKNTGVLDIWESADYGEGTVIACMDLGFTPNLGDGEISIDRWVNPLNTTKQTGTDDDPVPCPTGAGLSVSDKNHGNISQSIIFSYPVSTSSNMFGIAPKSKCMPIKLFGDLANEGETNNFVRAFKHIIDNSENITTVCIPLSCILYNPKYDRETKEFIEIIDKLKNSTEISILSASGNYGNDTYCPYESPYTAIKDLGFTVGGVLDDGSIYTNSSKTLRTEVLAPSESLTYRLSNGNTKTGNGTTYATCVMNGCMALIEVLLTKKLGRKPTRLEKYNFAISRTKTISGDRDLVGNGIFNFMEYNSNSKLSENEIDFMSII